MSEQARIYIDASEFTAQPHADDCPGVGKEPEVGFGLAGGGYGTYGYCPDCYAVLWKTEEREDD